MMDFREIARRPSRTGPRFTAGADFRVRRDMVVPFVLALARALEVKPEALAAAFMEDKEAAKFGKLFVAELIRLEAEKDEEE